MKIRTTELIEQLQADVRQLILKTEYLQTEETRTLIIQPAAEKWSITQVLEHLNSYGRYYLPAIEKSLAESRKPGREWFKAGWLGNYFTKIMRPGVDGKIANKMQAPRNHRPRMIFDADSVINDFLEQQYILLNLLQDATKKDIGNIRTPVSISRFIRLKTGDTFRFLIAHEQRHFVQIDNTLKQIKEMQARQRLINTEFTRTIPPVGGTQEPKKLQIEISNTELPDTTF
ncbi:MAG TPA: DinB family protein [Chitinophagaceae bacterium]|nr:DinB family protein [Chitinophagaceae bacterium]